MNTLKILVLGFCLLVVPFAFAQEQERDWVAFSQTLDLQVNKNLAFELTASLKTDIDEAFSKKKKWKS